MVRGISRIDATISRAPAPKPACAALLFLKFRKIFRRILLRRKNRPKHGAQKRRRANVKRKTHGKRNRPRRPGSRHVKNIGQQIRQRRGNHRTQPNEKALHGKAASALKFRQQVGHKRTKGLHADVDASVENPEQARCHPQRGTARHQDQRRSNSESRPPESKDGAGPAGPRCGRWPGR